VVRGEMLRHLEDALQDFTDMQRVGEQFGDRGFTEQRPYVIELASDPGQTVYRLPRRPLEGKLDAHARLDRLCPRRNPPGLFLSRREATGPGRRGCESSIRLLVHDSIVRAAWPPRPTGGRYFLLPPTN
jgi:hypothetical protein